MNPHEIGMLRLLSGYWFSQTLYVVAALGIPDRLAAGPKTAEALAEEAAVDREALYRLLRGLSSAGIFAEVAPRTFALTPLSETLLEDRKASLRPVALLGGHPLHWQAWGNLLNGVKTGQTAFEFAHGRPFFDAVGADGELLRVFQRVLSGVAYVDQAVIAALDFGACGRIVDVGGGIGELSGRLAAAHPHAEVVLFDRQEVLDAAPARPGVTLVAGDFFEKVPEDGDVYVLKFTLHDFDDRDAVRILENCRDAMRPGGRVLVVEVLVPDGPEPSIAKTHDVNMLVLSGGRERTLAEYSALISSAGLSLLRAIATTSDASVLEAARGAKLAS